MFRWAAPAIECHDLLRLARAGDGAMPGMGAVAPLDRSPLEVLDTVTRRETS